MLNDLGNEESKFATKKWYVIDSQTAKDKYNKASLLILRQKILSLCHYSDALGKFSKVGAGNNKDVA